MNKAQLKQNIKKIRPYLGILIMVTLIFVCTGIVFFSVASCLAFPLLWVIFTAFYHFKPHNRKIIYSLNAVRLAMWVYFSTIFLLLIYMPRWLKLWSLQLEHRTWWNVFKEGSFMYGRTSVAFVLSVVVLGVFFLHYKWTKKKDLLSQPPPKA